MLVDVEHSKLHGNLNLSSRALDGAMDVAHQDIIIAPDAHLLLVGLLGGSVDADIDLVQTSRDQFVQARIVQQVTVGVDGGPLEPFALGVCDAVV